MFGILVGGIGLFLLGMRLMTDGLKFAAGNAGDCNSGARMELKRMGGVDGRMAKGAISSDMGPCPGTGP